MADKQGAAEIKLRKEKFFIAANSVVMGWLDEEGVRRGMTMTDWDAYAKTFPSDVENNTLGYALREALAASRVGLPGEWADARLGAADYDARLASAFGLRTTKGLYPGMKDVAARWSLGEVTLSPSRHRRGSAFGGFPHGVNHGHEEIVTAFTSNDDELGAAVRECFKRCL
jgi:hypothetical protein